MSQSTPTTGAPGTLRPDAPSWASLPLDQAVALRGAAQRLADDFTGVFGPETIERFLHTSFDQFASTATVPTFLPLMAERFARQRLHALAKVEGLHDDGKPTVLFLCTHNAGRSQMAMGFFTHLAGDAAVAWSGGSEPGTSVNPAAVAAMAERGIDISGEFPKPWTDETVRAADVVITMGCGDACPVFPGKRYEEWVLEDPAGQELADVRPIRDDIERRVRRLLDQLAVPTR
jgi:protein-tyrosine-phosphatase